jgi:membrane protease YdiL (CAAX protease family)
MATAPHAVDHSVRPPSYSRFLWFASLTCLTSWVIWFPMLFRENNMDGIGSLLLLVGAFTPTVLGAVFVLRGAGRSARRDFLKRAWRIDLIPLAWWPPVVLFPLVGWALPIGLAVLMTDATFSLETGWVLFGGWAGLVPSLLIYFVAGPLAEEWGWRGFALDELLGVDGMVRANLVLFLVWACWHWPLFFSPGLNQHSLGVLTWDGLSWLTGTFFLTVFMTWVYLNTRRSILSAVLIHFFFNAIGSLLMPGFDVPPGTTPIRPLASIVFFLLFGIWILWRLVQTSSEVRS